jgi:hypothetical protein
MFPPLRKLTPEIEEIEVFDASIFAIACRRIEPFAAPRGLDELYGGGRRAALLWGTAFVE